MHTIYHTAIVTAQFDELTARAKDEHWVDTYVERDGPLIYVRFHVDPPKEYTYLCRIDMSQYPVDPYWIGFINPDLPRPRWSEASVTDPRFWPLSPIAGLHGSFILSFQGAFRTFWCRECNFPFFFYHGDRRWNPKQWHLSFVVSYLHDAIQKAEPPSRWRPIQRQGLLQRAAELGLSLPTGAGDGEK